VNFDSVVASSIAKKLNDRANFIVIFWVLIGLGVGALPGIVLAFSDARGGWIILFLGAGAAIGNDIGQGKALEYRWQCHLLLTALQVEANTNHIRVHTRDAADAMYTQAYPKPDESGLEAMIVEAELKDES
jgi:hypothetical protein